MAGKIAERLKQLKIELPQVTPPAFTYVPYVISSNLLFISGQIPLSGQAVMVQGVVGSGLTIADGQRAARQCALNILAQAAAALKGDLDRITQVVRLGVFVACTPSFFQQSQVANGASDLFVEILGDAGRHTRAAVGVPSLPREAAVEVEALMEIAN